MILYDIYIYTQTKTLVGQKGNVGVYLPTINLDLTEKNIYIYIYIYKYIYIYII